MTDLVLVHLSSVIPKFCCIGIEILDLTNQHNVLEKVLGAKVTIVL